MDWFGRSMGVAMLVLSGAASAQTIGDGGGGESGGGASISAPPAEKIVTSEGGVDMRSGSYAVSETDLAPGNIIFIRQLSSRGKFHVKSFINFSHRWGIILYKWGGATLLSRDSLLGEFIQILLTDRFLSNQA